MERITKCIDKFADRNDIEELTIGLLNGSEEFYYRSSKAIQTDRKLFELASVGKLFTATAVLLSCHSNRISLSDKIGKYLQVDASFKDVTILSLLNHTSGLPNLPMSFLEVMKKDKLNPYKNLTENHLAEFLNRPLIYKPGRCLYSNLGYGLLGKILEMIFSMPYEDVIDANILKPLRLVDIVCYNKDINADIIQGYNYQNEVVGVWEDRVLKGAGIHLSTPGGMVKFLNSFSFGLQHLVPQSFRMHSGNYTNGGWHKQNLLLKYLGWNSYFRHAGMSGGHSCFVYFSPKKKVGFILFSNKAVPLGQLSFQILSYL